jgi:hypothetical protein
MRFLSVDLVTLSLHKYTHVMDFFKKKKGICRPLQILSSEFDFVGIFTVAYSNKNL